MSWLNPLRKSLDERSTAVPFFFRDDDAGWEDTRLFQLIDVFANHKVPVDLAAIPKSLSRRTAARLRRLIEADSTSIGVHQHGYAHVNHEPEGRKNEFGPARSWREQLNDIRTGQSLLSDLLGPITDSIFTPPWNRCSDITAVCLWETKFKYVSRDKTALPLAGVGLQELSISVDWFAHRKGVRLTPDELGNLCATAVREQPAVGVMLHHAVMDDYEFRRLRQFLEFITSHSQVRCVLMRDAVQEINRGKRRASVARSQAR
ncbi:MAG TPA: DUF2334 domain-containing protein [Pyrinomonadaceae bacterium]|nr:DUF2334 domain-containing protein [Pyrinomonadaceae bacterium]